MSFDLISRLKKGEESVFRDLFDQYYVSLTAFAFRFTKNREASKDIVQDLLIKIYQDRTSLAIHTNIKSYLYKAVYNASINELKRQNVRDKHHLAFASESGAVHMIMPLKKMKRNIKFIRLSKSSHRNA